MNIELSKYELNEILDFSDMINLLSHFSKLTEIDVSLHSKEGEEVLSYRLQPENSICELVKNQQNNCNYQMKYAGLKSAELGEPYIFQCGTMIKCSVPIFFEEKYLGSLACGPVLLWEPDEIAKKDLKQFTEKYHLEKKDIKQIIECVRQLTPENMRSAAGMLSLMVSYMCKDESIFIKQRNKITKQQDKIANLLIEKRIAAKSIDRIEKQNKFKKYPYELEKELIAYLQNGETKSAMEILNSLLSEIFSLSLGNLDTIKANIFELSAVLMRAAVDSGVSLSDMHEIMKKITIIIANETEYEEVCLLTAEIMEAINNVISNNKFTKKSNENLIKAINYIKKNYRIDVSLETVAKNVFVSNYYLSHLFRDEMNMTFIDYVNKVRIEAAVKLMKETNLTIQEIISQTGFSDHSYFIKIFKRHHGITPKKYMSLFL
ncbi:MAG: PocR ligand-binding domain-containing protein [Candidatus Izemoplasmatales bacterium]|nr:PocR ligand-binding domain-containing protein [Candidatus Izemoplasmatales bacterium]MDY0138155.1 PocR ligand-binding domain-containing protein [Candidatus Izemoplasmatales bacterium]